MYRYVNIPNIKSTTGGTNVTIPKNYFDTPLRWITTYGTIQIYNIAMAGIDATTSNMRFYRYDLGWDGSDKLSSYSEWDVIEMKELSRTSTSYTYNTKIYQKPNTRNNIIPYDFTRECRFNVITK